ncbi:MAG: hypothetical protein R2704_01000 [Microthrixaceae bacterium]
MEAEGPFAELVGQDPAVAQLHAALDRPVPAYLFVGQTGWGTRRAADLFAGELLARIDPDGEARHRRLAAAEAHPAVAVVERTGAAISVDEAREIARRAELAPPEGTHQVLILVDFHLVRSAAPALLKTIEEPPASTTFVVLAEEVTPELITIASRCLRVDFRPIPTDALVAAAAEEGFDPDAAATAARAAGGDLERVRALLSDEAASQRWRRWAQLLERVDGTAATATGLVAELIADLDAAGEALAAGHARQLEAFDAAEDAAARGQAGRRKRLEDRHKRESRRLRNDALRAGMAALADEARATATTPAGADTYTRVGAALADLELALLHNAREDLALLALVMALGQGSAH